MTEETERAPRKRVARQRVNYRNELAELKMKATLAVKILSSLAGTNSALPPAEERIIKSVAELLT